LSVVVALAAATGCISPSSEAQDEADLLIRGGMVFDGVSDEGYRADVAVRGDRIVFVGDARRRVISAAKTIDAAGLLVTPGLIDPHTHSGDDLSSGDPTRRSALNHLMQGVTTVFIGNDGGGSADVPTTLAKASGAGVNVGTFIGFGAVRRQLIGDADRAPTSSELERMKLLVARGMCAGALGFSTGLYYAPQSFSGTSEVLALAREAAARDGIYESHLRDEGSAETGLLPALDEAIGIGRDAGLPVHVAHIKALGIEAQGSAPEMIRKIEAARRSGLRVTADQYPWNASGTRLTSALVPGWALDGGRAALQKRLGDSSLEPRLLGGVGDNLRKRGGAAAVLITGGPYAGKRLDAVAAELRLGPEQAVLRLLRDHGDATVASFNMADADIDAFAAMPWVIASSDATAGHPRKFGSFARRWERFVRDEARLSVGQFVRRSSALTAEIFGLSERGALKAGNYADIAVIDPKSYAAQADYEQPERLASGVRTVVVNGQLVVQDGRPTGRLAGRAITKAEKSSWSCPQ